jgi:hypothetical protein
MHCQTQQICAEAPPLTGHDESVRVQRRKIFDSQAQLKLRAGSQIDPFASILSEYISDIESTNFVEVGLSLLVTVLYDAVQRHSLSDLFYLAHMRYAVFLFLRW